MNPKFVPNINIQNGMEASKLYNYANPVRLEGFVQETKGESFKDVMGGMVGNLNETIQAPDGLMENAMMGKGADVHDVIVAMTKAELGINIATQVTTKVVQSYEKIMSIQV